MPPFEHVLAQSQSQAGAQPAAQRVASPAAERKSSTAADHSCQTYSSRYAQCLKLWAKKRRGDRKATEKAIAKSSATQDAMEVVVIRVSREEWTKDLWVATCTVLLEAGARGSGRHVRIYVPMEYSRRVPHEFRAVTLDWSDIHLRRNFRKAWSDGWARGDLVLVHFMVTWRKYGFIWNVEPDLRLAGHWGELFEAARTPGSDGPDLVGVGLKQQRAHKPTPSEWSLLQPINFKGSWRLLYEKAAASNASFFAGPSVLLGMSRKLTNSIWTSTRNGDYHTHIEVNPGFAAFLFGLKAVPDALPDLHRREHFYVPSNKWSKDVRACKFYTQWRDGNISCAPSQLMHPIKSAGKDDDTLPCHV